MKPTHNDKAPKGETPTQTNATGVSGEQLSFLPTLPFSPIWPSHTTIAGRVLAEFLRGEFLDHEDVIDGCSSWRLAAYVDKLKKMGWPVVAFEKPAPSSGCPSRTIALYALPPEIISQALSLRGAHA